MRTQKLPFYLLVGFNLLTWIIYLSNPYLASSTDTHILTVIYVLLNIICLAVGFRTGERVSGSTALVKVTYADNFYKRFYTKYFIFYILTFLLKYAYELRIPAFNINALITRVLVGISNPEIGYVMTLEGAQSYSWSIYQFINLFDCGFFIVGMLCWRYLSKFEKTTFSILVVFELLKWFGAGTSFGIMQISTTLALVYVASMSIEYLSKKQLFKISFVLGLVFIFAVIAFGSNMQGRSGGELRDIQSSQVNLDSFVFKYFVAYLPTWFQDLYDFVVRYLVGGYYNLEYAFRCDYDWCMFLGNNNALTTLADDVFHLGVEENSYPIKIFHKFGVDPYIYWHSCYTWLANDFTLFGVPLVVYWIGRTTSLALSMFRQYNDMVSGVIYVILGNVIIFFFANNNYLSGHFYLFMIVFLYWVNVKYRIK